MSNVQHSYFTGEVAVSMESVHKVALDFIKNPVAHLLGTF